MSIPSSVTELRQELALVLESEPNDTIADLSKFPDVWGKIRLNYQDAQVPLLMKHDPLRALQYTDAWQSDHSRIEKSDALERVLHEREQERLYRSEKKLSGEGLQ